MSTASKADQASEVRAKFGHVYVVFRRWRPIATIWRLAVLRGDHFDIEDDHQLDRRQQADSFVLVHELGVDLPDVGVHHLIDIGQHIGLKVHPAHRPKQAEAFADSLISEFFYRASVVVNPVLAFSHFLEVGLLRFEVEESLGQLLIALLLEAQIPMQLGVLKLVLELVDLVTVGLEAVGGQGAEPAQ